MDRNEFVSTIRETVNYYTGEGMRPSAAFLRWFLVNYFRVEDDDATDCICDNTNDKGIDGVYVDELSQEILVLQTKYSSSDGNQGDNDLRNFIGAKIWFASPENVDALGDTTANKELKALVKRLDIANKIQQGYEVTALFVTSKSFDYNAAEYLTVASKSLDAWDIQRLFDSYTYPGKDRLIQGEFNFDVERKHVINYPLTGQLEVVVFPAKANQIIQLDGIQDRTIFDRNVRYGLGRTRVNREIAKTLSLQSEHNKFFVYHNGITLVCSDFSVCSDKVTVEDYAIVNGCQSTLTFYENKRLLDDQIVVLLRVIKTGSDQILSERITHANNNQNAITARDLHSNDKVQQDVQKQFSHAFDGKVLYKIKRGEEDQSYERVIENDLAAQLLVSFLVQEPHVAHQKAKLFEDRYNDIFSRHASPHLILLLHDMYRAIEERKSDIKDEGMRTYGSTKFFYMYLFRLVCEDEKSGKELLQDPSRFYGRYAPHYYQAFEKLIQLLSLDLNNYVDDAKKNEHYFDYKNVLRNGEMVRRMANEVITAYKKGLVHHPEDALTNLLGTVSIQ